MVCDIKYLLEWMKAIHPCLPSRVPARLHLQTAQPGAGLRRFGGGGAAARGGREPGRGPWGGETPLRAILCVTPSPSCILLQKKKDFGTASQCILPIAPTSPVPYTAPARRTGVPQQLQPSRGRTPPFPLTPAPAPAPAASAASRCPPH